MSEPDPEQLTEVQRKRMAAAVAERDGVPTTDWATQLRNEESCRRRIAEETNAPPAPVVTAPPDDLAGLCDWCRRWIDELTHFSLGWSLGIGRAVLHEARCAVAKMGNGALAGRLRDGLPLPSDPADYWHWFLDGRAGRVPDLLAEVVGWCEGRPPAPECRLVVRDGALFLDGSPVSIGGTSDTLPIVLAIISDLITHPGAWRSGSDMAKAAPEKVLIDERRIWRYLRHLPDNIRPQKKKQALIESMPKGYRLSAAAWRK